MNRSMRWRIKTKKTSLMEQQVAVVSLCVETFVKAPGQQAAGTSMH